MIILSPASQRLQQRNRSRFARIIVPCLVVAVMIAAMFGIAMYQYYENRHAALALSNDLLDAMDGRIATEVETYLEPAARMVELAADLGAKEAFAVNQESQIEPLAIEILRSHQQLAMFNIADTQGNFIMPKKMPNGAIDTKFISRTEESAQVEWIRRNETGSTVKVEMTDFDGYDPRERPWYKGAIEKKGLYWSDIYIFFTDRKPGITAAYPITNEFDSTLGVLGIDIELDQLCDFLAGLKIGESGKAMIIDNNGTLIAYPDINKMMVEENDKLRPVNITELNDLVLTRAFNKFRVKPIEKEVIEVNEKRYIVTTQALDASVGRQWTVLVVVPEQDFIGFVANNNRKGLMLSMIVVVVAAGLAGLLVVQGLRSDRFARLILSREEEFEQRSSAFTELTKLATLLAQDPQQAVEKMTELAASTTRSPRVSVWKADYDRAKFICMDTFEAEGSGHTHGMEFDLSDFSDVFIDNAQGELIVRNIDESVMNTDLARDYFKPLGVSQVLASPVVCAEKTVGYVWLEDQARRAEWTADSREFAASMASVLAIGYAVNQNKQPTFTAPTDTNHVSAIKTNEGMTSDARSASRSASSLAEFSRKVAPQPMLKRQSDKIDACQSVRILKNSTVLVVHLLDSNIMARSDFQAGCSIQESLQSRFEEAAHEAQVTWMNSTGTSFVCAATESGGSYKRMAELALKIRDICVTVLARVDYQIPVRIGMDTGTAFSTTPASNGSHDHLWGEAFTIAGTMAQYGVAGSIHVTAELYEQINADFLLKDRGRFFVETLGEVNTYLLVGRVNA